MLDKNSYIQLNDINITTVSATKYKIKTMIKVSLSTYINTIYKFIFMLMSHKLIEVVGKLSGKSGDVTSSGGVTGPR